LKSCFCGGFRAEGSASYLALWLDFVAGELLDPASRFDIAVE
jgi:hypothetical protein